jgi:DNA adenine methylase
MSAAWGGGPLLLTDVHGPLISLYRAFAAGWRPSTDCIYDQAAWQALSDTDPLKAFVGFGCAYGGDYGRLVASGRDWNGDTLAAQALRSLERTFSTFTDTTFSRVDFLAEPVSPVDGIIYCDPPYAGVTGYTTGAFDQARFLSRVAEWADGGATVFVSEYAFPIGTEVLSLDRARHLKGSGRIATEKLFRIGPHHAP